jgi:hypothetical protein
MDGRAVTSGDDERPRLLDELLRKPIVGGCVPAQTPPARQSQLMVRRLAVCDGCWERRNPGAVAAGVGWETALPAMRDQMTCIDCLKQPGTVWVRMSIEWP